MKLRLNKHQQRGPLGGHHYPSHGRTFQADSFQQLVTTVRMFRVANGMVIGDPEQDVLLFYAKHFPWLVEPSLDSPEQTNELYVQWRDWVGRTWKQAPKKFVPTKDARARWAICEKCPFNVAFNWRETDESAAFAKRAFVLRRGLDVPGHLGYCAAHKFDLGVASVLEDAKSVSSIGDREQPKVCWVGVFAGC